MTSIPTIDMADLVGKYVKLRNGQKAYVVGQRNATTDDFVLDAVDDDDFFAVNRNGRYNTVNVRESYLDVIGIWEEPFEFNYWHFLRPEIICIAYMPFGTWYACQSIPTTESGFWSGELPAFTLDALHPDLLPDTTGRDWTKCLIHRPTNNTTSGE